MIAARIRSGLICLAGLILACCNQTGSKPGDTKPNTDIIAAQMAPDLAPHEKGMVAAANPHAVEAGLAILRQGGSAVDAAIAVQAVLGLVEPQSSGIGGGAFMVFYDAGTGAVTAYNGREQAPEAIDENLFIGEDGKPLRYLDAINSGRSTGAPGAIAMLAMAHKDHGRIDWADSFTPGIALAETGFEISPRLAGLIKRAADYGLGAQQAAKAYFFDANGEPMQAGDKRDNQPYAQTLKAIAANPRALYEGPIADAIITAVKEQNRPGALTLADLAAYRPSKDPALCSFYRDNFICGAQPPSSGGVAVQSILGQLQNFDLAAMGNSVAGWHHFSEASALAYADRNLYVADPDFVKVPTRSLLNAGYLKSRAALISPDSALTDVRAGTMAEMKRGADATPDVPGTSHYSIVDKFGNVVSMTTTVESVFGSKRMAAGFLLNNQLTDFSFAHTDASGNKIANRPQPRKRPRSSMAPHIVFDADGQFYFATGSPGGSSIIAYTAKTIVGIIDWGLDPQAAINLPNVISRRGKIRLEEGRLDPDIISGLEDLGHEIVRSKGEISGLHIVRRRPDGTYDGGADPRREGQARSE